MKAYAPNGERITGTLETLNGVALIHEDVTRQEDGKFTFQYAGETKVWWDDQVTVKRGDKIVFVDESGAEWTEDEIILKDE